MFGEIIKILADEPEKIEKVVIGAVKAFFNIIIAAFLFQVIIGKFYVFDLRDYREWINFLLSGKILVCLFFYFISAYIIVPVINMVSQILITWVANWNIFNITSNDLLDPLKFFGVIKINPSEKIPLPGRNIDILYGMSDSDSVEEIKALKDTIIENVWNLYMVFVLLYCFILDKSIHTSALTLVVFAGLIIVTLLYIGIHASIKYMVENHSKIYSSLSFIKVVNRVNIILKSFGILPISPPLRSGLTKFKIFHLINKEYVLVYTLFGKKVKLDEVEKLLSRKRRLNRVFILVSHKEFIDDTHELQFKFPDSFIPIIYTDEKNLEAQLKNTIESIIK